MCFKYFLKLFQGCLSLIIYKMELIGFVTCGAVRNNQVSPCTVLSVVLGMVESLKQVWARIIVNRVGSVVVTACGWRNWGMLNMGGCSRAFGARISASAPESTNLPPQYGGGTQPLEDGVMTLRYASHHPLPTTHHSPLNCKKLLIVFSQWHLLLSPKGKSVSTLLFISFYFQGLSVRS